MSEIIQINQLRTFTLEEAQEILPVVRRVTGRFRSNYEQLRARLDSGVRSPEQTSKIEADLNRTVVEWSDVIKRLGCEVRGLWIVDFDSGQDFYCWKWPEEELLYRRNYGTGFSTRLPISMDENSQIHSGS